MDGLGDGTSLCVSTYPVAWRIEVVKDEYIGYEYVRSSRALPNVPAGLADMTSQLFLGNYEKSLGPRGGWQGER